VSSSSKPLTHRRTSLKKILIIIGIIVAVIVVQTLPVFIVKPLGAKEYANTDVVVYYQPGDETGAREIFDLVANNITGIKAKMKYASHKPLEIYVYKTQSLLAMTEAGFAALLVAPSWFIGNSRWGVIRMVSPNTKVKGHTHDTILNGTLHEVVHSINYYKNPHLSYFWDNGLATYLANQKPDQGSVSFASFPSFEDLQTNSALRFGNMGGYAYSYSYIEYLDKTYGWDSVMAFASGEKDYQQAFGKSELEIYTDWGGYIKQQERGARAHGPRWM
jgi:hypothetical protein